MRQEWPADNRVMTEKTSTGARNVSLELFPVMNGLRHRNISFSRHENVGTQTGALESGTNFGAGEIGG